MEILDDFLLRNKIVNLKLKITDKMESDIWDEVIDGIKGNLLETHEVIHEDRNMFPIDILMHLELKYSEYRKIIRKLQTYDRTLMYDPKTRLTYIIVSIKNSLQKREVS